MVSDLANGFSHRHRNSFFASLAIWGCAIRIASHIAVASHDLGHQDLLPDLRFLAFSDFLAVLVFKEFLVF